MRRISSGLYAYLPLLFRVLNKISDIVRSEMDATGGTGVLAATASACVAVAGVGGAGILTPKLRGLCFTLGDRRQQELALGPTHEEVITAVARETIRSYRQLPVHLYQIQTKFRDEIRPRFGLLRGREFIMKRRLFVSC